MSNIINQFRRYRKYQIGGYIPKYQTSGVIEYNPSQDIIDYIKSTEAFKGNWYKDGNGIWTIGYGFKETPELRRRFANGMTRQQADEYFNTVISDNIDSLKRNTPNFDKLNQNQRDALLSYLYNIGVGGYTRKSPKLQKALANLNHSEITNQIDFGYNDSKNRGLRKRRDYERALYNTPIAEEKTKEQIAEQSFEQPVQPIQYKSMVQDIRDIFLSDPYFYGNVANRK